MATKKPIVKKEVILEKVVEKTIEKTPNLIRVRQRSDKSVIIIDANKEFDYKTKYLHISWNKFTD